MTQKWRQVQQENADKERANMRGSQEDSKGPTEVLPAAPMSLPLKRQDSMHQKK